MAWAGKLPSGKYRGVYRDGAGKRRSAGTFSHKAKAERGSITRHDVKAWAMQVRRTGISPATVQRIVHLSSASLNVAVDAEVLEVNPASRIKLPKGALEQERFLTHDEYDAVRAELPARWTSS